MERSHSIHHEHSFAAPDSIQILGSRQEDASNIREADVLFADEAGNYWYLTVVTGEQYVADTLNTWRDSKQTQEHDVQDREDVYQEPPKFVWNGGMLDDDGIKDLVQNASLELLAPFIISIPEEALEDLTNNRSHPDSSG